jgi:hypothetical protein
MVILIYRVERYHCHQILMSRHLQWKYDLKWLMFYWMVNDIDAITRVDLFFIIFIIIIIHTINHCTVSSVSTMVGCRCKPREGGGRGKKGSKVDSY